MMGIGMSRIWMGLALNSEEELRPTYELLDIQAQAQPNPIGIPISRIRNPYFFKSLQKMVRREAAPAADLITAFPG